MKPTTTQPSSLFKLCSCSDQLWSTYLLSSFFNSRYMIQQNWNHHLWICVLVWLCQVSFGISCSLLNMISKVTPIKVDFCFYGTSCRKQLLFVIAGGLLFGKSFNKHRWLKLSCVCDYFALSCIIITAGWDGQCSDLLSDSDKFLINFRLWD